MEDPIQIIYKYLDTLNISVDRSEVHYQLNSHPDYPSLLSISDTLNFFKINNGAFRVKAHDFENLPSSFIVRLNKDDQKFLSLIHRRKKDLTFSDKDFKSKRIDKSDLLEMWDDVVLIAEGSSFSEKPKTFVLDNKILPVIIIITTVLVYFFSNSASFSLYLIPLLIFSLLGFLVSLMTLKEVFRLNNSMIDAFCPSSTTVDCNDVINSSNWKIFRILNFSDLSLTLFTSQIIFFIPFALTYPDVELINLYRLLFLLSIPLLLMSLYYQKVIVKKWCALCLTINCIIAASGFYAFFAFSQTIFSFSLKPFLVYGIIFLTVWYIWAITKKFLIQYTTLENEIFKANRFKRNYALFTNNLVQAHQYKLPESMLSFGNPDSDLQLTILTSPLCGHCEEPHRALYNILKKYGEKLSINIIFNVNPANTVLQSMVETVIQIHIEKGGYSYFENIDDWYRTKDYSMWMANHERNKIDDIVKEIIQNQRQWCNENSFNFTPAFFVNNYKFPTQYEISEIEFFIEDLLKDMDKQKLKAETEKLVIE